MRRSWSAALVAVGSLLAVPALAAPTSEELERVVSGIRWLGQASLRIEAAGLVVHVDPQSKYRASAQEADVVLITHGHWDHFEEPEVLRLAKASGLVIAPFNIRAKVPGRAAILKSGESIAEGGLTIEAVPAYNRGQHHPRSDSAVGYVLTAGGVRIYVAGDTGRTAEMKDLSCDVAILPLGPKYTMAGRDEAAQAALDVKASIAIPYHWGTNEGTRGDALAFRRLLEGKAKVVILDP